MALLPRLSLRPAVIAFGNPGPRPREDWRKLARKIEESHSGLHDLLDADASDLADAVTRAQARQPGDRRANTAQLSSPPRQSDAVVIKVDSSCVTTERHREAGPVHVGYLFWQRLELDRIL